MNRVGVMEFVWLRLKRLPKSVWLAIGFALLLIPALLLWLVISLVGGVWQSGGALVDQGRAVLQQVLPAQVEELARELPPSAALAALPAEAQQQLQAEVERLQSTLPASAQALQQDLAGAVLPAAAALQQLTEQGRAGADRALALLAPAPPATDVGGEDPPGVVRLPGFVRTAFARDGDSLKVSWSGAAPHAEVVAFYTQQLGAAGYRAQILQADKSVEVVSFESSQRQLTLTARAGARGGSDVDWEVR